MTDWVINVAQISSKNLIILHVWLKDDPDPISKSDKSKYLFG